MGGASTATMAASLAIMNSRGVRELCSTEAMVMSASVSRTGPSVLMNSSSDQCDRSVLFQGLADIRQKALRIEIREPFIYRSYIAGSAVEVVAAAVGAQAPQRHDVDGDDHQGPERVAGEEEHLADGVQADQGHPGPAGGLVAGQYPDRGQGLEHAQDQGDPAPGAQVAEHVARVADEYAGPGDRGDAVDDVEQAEHAQQIG